MASLHRSSTIIVQSRWDLWQDPTTENGSSGNPKRSAVGWRHNEPGQVGRLPGKIRAPERVGGTMSVVFMLTSTETGGRSSRKISSAISSAIGYVKFFSRSHDAVIRVYDVAGNVIETHEQAGDFQRAGT